MTCQRATVAPRRLFGAQSRKFRLNKRSERLEVLEQEGLLNGRRDILGLWEDEVF